MSPRVLDPNIVSGKTNLGNNHHWKHNIQGLIRGETGRLGNSHAKCSTEDLCGNGEVKGNIHLPLYLLYVLHQRQPSFGREESLPDCGSFLEAQ